MVPPIPRLLDSFFPRHLEFRPLVSSLINKIKQVVQHCLDALKELYYRCCGRDVPSPPPSMAGVRSTDAINGDLSALRLSGEELARLPLEIQEPSIGEPFSDGLGSNHPRSCGQLLQSVYSDPLYRQWDENGKTISVILLEQVGTGLSDDLLDHITMEPFDFPLRVNCCSQVFNQKTLKGLSGNDLMTAFCPYCRQGLGDPGRTFSLEVAIQEKVLNELCSER